MSLINQKAEEHRQLRQIAGAAALPSPEEVRQVLLISVGSADRLTQAYVRQIAARMTAAPWYGLKDANG